MLLTGSGEILFGRTTVTKRGGRAVVCGASMAGLLAARVVSEFYESVTLVERDVLPTDSAQRRGVPQARHLHALLSRGSQALGDLLPGVLDELAAAGANVIDDGDLSALCFRIGEHELNRSGKFADPASLVVHIASRPMLESHVRRRVRAIENVTILDGHDVVGPIAAQPDRVTGARVVNRDTGEETVLDAELVIDATGRAARAMVFLEKLGYGRPVEQRQTVDLNYSSQFLRIPAGMVPEKMIALGVEPERPTGAGLLAYEDGAWILTLIGVAGHQLPKDLTGMIDCFAEFAPPSLVTALQTAEPVGDVSAQHYPSSSWRRYDKMRRFPAGLLVCGDAVCSFNPVYGQGMTMAALQAVALRRCLAHRDDGDLSRRFFRASAKQIAPVWRGNRLNDFAAAPVTGWRSVPRRLLNWNVDKFMAAAQNDIAVTEAFVRLLQMQDPATRLLRPSVLARVVAANRRIRADRRRATGVFGRPAALDEA
jgi:2-polyprenyl-6-methoxyphenol hydroxylase-like FAD-dependent oxidoreductase